MEESDEITLKIRNPNNEDLLNLTIPKSTLISEVKQTICERLPSNPLPNTQKLIYRGRLCKDACTVKEMLPTDFIDKEVFMHIIIPQASVKPIVPPPQQQQQPISSPQPQPSPKPIESSSPTPSISSTIPNPPSSVQSPLEPPPISQLTMNSLSPSPTSPYMPTSTPLSPEQIDYMNQAITYYQQYLTQYQNYISSFTNPNQTLLNQQQRNSPIDDIHIPQGADQQQQQQVEQQARIHRIKLVFDIKMIIQLIVFGCVFGQGYTRKGRIIIGLLCLFLYLIKTGMFDPMKYVINSDRGTIRQDESCYYDYVIPILSFFLSLYPGWNPEAIPLPQPPQQPVQQEDNNPQDNQPQPINNGIEQQQQQPISNNNNNPPPVSLANDDDNNQSHQIIDDKKEK